MKIAVASEGKTIAQHFGYCQNFNIYHIEEGEVTKVESVENPGHKPGFLPQFLHDMGVGVIVSGGMGARAVEIFNENGIEVVIGISGNSASAVESYLAGELESTGTICDHHSS
ncbi:MAG TPA: dinitrogenase iron-molybdenum cofactor [Tepidimicrobium sp.]|nr:dinitrogenase iron-molybdenum cofactor [Tepidimicrobium sp.]